MSTSSGRPSVPDPIALIHAAPATRPFVVAQLGQSLDGRIATSTGESRWINGEAALDHVHRIRAVVDAVLVGVGTVVADDPLLNVRRVPGRNPARVVIDPSGRVPPTARLFGEDGARRIVVAGLGTRFRGALPAGVEVMSIAPDGGGLCPRAIVSTLWQAGVRSLLVEGGATTVSRFIDAGAVDRLHMLVAPMIIGSGKHGLVLHPISRLSEAARPAAHVHVLPGGDVLFDCDMRSSGMRPR